MKRTITARHFEMTEAIKSHVNQKLDQFNTEIKGIIEADFILEVEKNPKVVDNQIAELNIFISGEKINSKVASADLYKSIDQVSDKVIKILGKHQNKHQEVKHHDKNKTHSVLDSE